MTRWLDGQVVADPRDQHGRIARAGRGDGSRLRLFFCFVRGDAGAFVLIELPSEVAVGADDDGSVEPGHAVPDSALAELRAARLALGRSKAVPLTTRTTDEHGRWVIDASVAFLGSLFATTLAVAPDGDVGMLENYSVATLDGLSMADYLSLELAPDQPDQPRGRVRRQSWPYGPRRVRHRRRRDSHADCCGCSPSYRADSGGAGEGVQYRP